MGCLACSVLILASSMTSTKNYGLDNSDTFDSGELDAKLLINKLIDFWSATNLEFPCRDSWLLSNTSGQINLENFILGFQSCSLHTICLLAHLVQIFSHILIITIREKKTSTPWMTKEPYRSSVINTAVVLFWLFGFRNNAYEQSVIDSCFCKFFPPCIFCFK